MAWFNFSHLLVLLCILHVQAQSIPRHCEISHTATDLTLEQFSPFGLPGGILDDVNAALRLERSNWATGSVFEDPFYTEVPPNATCAPAGSLLKVQPFVNTTLFTIPPRLSLSRILYVSETLNGTRVPASAYILWPYLPRQHWNNTVPLLGFAHGTSGGVPECAPSHFRDLKFPWIHTAALDGYAVVAPDYVGLGVPRLADGSQPIHQYTANPAHANDILYSVQAAQEAFENLSKEFIVIGHSQGGNAAWGAAQRQAENPVPGYLGTIAGAPGTNTTRLLEFTRNPVQRDWVTLFQAEGITQTFPEVGLSDILNQDGINVLNFARCAQICDVFSLLAALNQSNLNPGWLGSEYATLFQNITIAGKKPLGTPMLVLQGYADPLVPEPVTSEYLNLTCEMYPESEIEYWRFADTTHEPVMYASHRLWLQWIADRFAHRPLDSAGGRCVYKNFGFSTPRPLDQYKSETNARLQLID